MKKLSCAFAAVALSVLSGCATRSFTSPLPQVDRADPARSYVYGRFAINGILPIDVALNGYSSIGLKFNCENGEGFVVGLSPSEPEQVVEAPPGRCSLDSLLFTNGARFNNVSAEKPFTGRFLKNLVLEPGKAHYLGDFTGNYSLESHGSYVRRLTQLSEMKDNFERTTQTITARWPAFQRWPKVNALASAK